MSNLYEIQSPLPGTFYRQSSPTELPYKAVGELVAAGDVIGLVEVMKQFSEVCAEVNGRIQSFAVGNGEPVDPGQVLAVLELV